MSQVLANPESRDPPENNDPLKVETSKLISLLEKNTETDKINILNKCHGDPRFINNDYFTFLFIPLKVRDIQKVSLSYFFLRFYFLRCYVVYTS